MPGDSCTRCMCEGNEKFIKCYLHYTVQYRRKELVDRRTVLLAFFLPAPSVDAGSLVDDEPSGPRATRDHDDVAAAAATGAESDRGGAGPPTCTIDRALPDTSSRGHASCEAAVAALGAGRAARAYDAAAAAGREPVTDDASVWAAPGVAGAGVGWRLPTPAEALRRGGPHSWSSGSGARLIGESPLRGTGASSRSSGARSASNGRCWLRSRASASSRALVRRRRARFSSSSN